jgi:hypothetical protein
MEGRVGRKVELQIEILALDIWGRDIFRWEK